ncbi:MAG: GspH/FimT family pseudopilin [Lysobacter sp.]
MASRPAAGFTLIELMVTIGIGAILLTLALPSFTDSIRSNRVSTATNQILATINLARAEALRSKSNAWVCPTTDGATCAATWSTTAGLLVWTDENGDTNFTAAKVKRVIQPQEGILTIVNGFTKIGFDDRGRTWDQRSRTFTVQATQCKPGAYNLRSFDINRIGRVTVTKRTCS